MRGGRFTQSQRAKGGWFQKGVTGWRPESPLARPTQGADRWRRLRPLHPRCQEQLSTRRVWVSELSLGCSILEGRLGVGEGGGDDDDDEAPPTSPGQPERGGGNFRSALEEAGGGGGGCGPPSPPPPSWGGGSGSAQVPSLGRDRRVPDPPAPGAGGKDGTGQGATRGRSHPVCAVGEGPRAGVPDTQRSAGCIARAIPGCPARRGDTDFPAAEAWGCARGCRRAQPGDPGEAPLPGHTVEKGADDTRPPHPTPEREMFPEPRESAGGRRVVWGTRAARAGEDGGHSPLPPSRPHCLSRLWPGPAP